MPFAWAAFFGWPISCNTWAAGASPAGSAQDAEWLMLTSRSRLGQAANCSRSTSATEEARDTGVSK